MRTDSATSRTTQSDPAAFKKVVKRIHDLPTFPLVIRKLMEVAEDSRSSSRDLAQVMETDQGLCTKVLRLVNSAFYSFSKPVSSLQHAVTLLGYNSIRSLAMSVSVKGIFQDKSDFGQEPFWEHSLVTAIGAKLLGEKNGFPFKDDLFTAGLLHDIGILLEARYFPEELSRVVEAVRTGRTFVEAELETLGVAHTRIGAWLAERWNLPSGLREPIGRHHDSDPDGLADLSSESAEIVRYVMAANLMAKAMGYRIISGTDSVPDHPESVELPDHLRAVFGSFSISEFVDETDRRLKQSREFLAI